ncbi:LysR family transcriptional regulator [Aliikangiella coralliicola]|uniref:LysR family transcriptional regulator n=1 Tax=Aliikangiella coralliicola TaxID=2592383 RepID=A0A545U7E5_9GAMM|nr:LysR family transcriptional regulator [Aliikangiella coralliicola]TQV85390.1 LysR family transcriptional regulator [Aliikangiella coralliicola]
MKIDLDSIRVLRTIVEKGSFAAAAKTLHRAQSAISYQIKKLEEALNLEIFDRSEYRAELTPAGQMILEEGNRLLTQAEHIEGLAVQLNQEWEPTFEVVIDGILEIDPIMSAMRALLVEDIPTKISLTMEYLGGVQHRFDKNQADLMLVKEYQKSTQLLSKALPDVECLLCVAGNHPLASLDSVTIAQLQQHVELSVHDSSEQELYDVEHMHFGGERMFFLSDFKSKKEALLQGIGFGWMPHYLVKRELSEGSLKEVNYQHGSRFAFAPHLVWRAEKKLGKTAQRFIELLTHSYQEYNNRQSWEVVNA